jgi:glycogen operon protein
LATLLLSAGVPMVTAGDEVGKTQLGNNNAYCQDSNLSWVNWNLTEHQENLKATFSHLTKLRRENGSLRQPNFGNFDEAVAGNDMIKWFAEDGSILTEDQWKNSGQRTLMRLAKHINRDESTSNTTLLVIHGTESDIEVTLPEWEHDWEIVWDSALELPPEKVRSVKSGAQITMSATSMLLLRTL